MAKNFKSAKKTDRFYPIVYTINFYKNGKSESWARKNGLGACDAAFLAQIAKTEDGGRAVRFSSIDGKTGEDLNDQELLKIWGLLGERLSNSTMLHENTRKLCGDVWKAIKDAMSAKSGKGYLS